MNKFLLKLRGRRMPGVRGLVFVVAVRLIVFALAPMALGQEIRTYEFLVGDDFTFASDCGECSLVYGSRARVTGQFQVSLDVGLGTGVLQSLDVTLVDVERLTASIGGTIEWLPLPDRPFLGDSSFYDSYRPPLHGELVEMVGNGDLIFSSNSSNNGLVSPPGNLFSLVTSSSRIVMSGTDAELEFFVPFIDSALRISGATAKLVAIVPEPTSGSLIYLGIIMVGLATRTSRRFRKQR